MRMKALGVFLLAFCAAALPSAAQDQRPDQRPDQRQDQRQDQNSPADEPAAQQQPADPAPLAQAEEPQAQPPDEPQTQPPPQAAPAERGTIAPATLRLAPGALLAVRVNQWLSSDRNHPGDTFSATLDQPLVVQGWVVARRGQTVLGRVGVAQKASQGKGVSRLGLEITELTLVDGEQLPVSTEMQQAAPSPVPPDSGERSAERNVATVGTTTVLGTIAGAAIGGGEVAAIGAGLGAGAGLAAVLYTRARPTTVAPETLLSFRLQSPVEISTERGRVAFQPVTQADYKDQDAYANAPRLRRPGRGPGYPPYYYSGYCGPWGWNCYPGPYFGPYIGVGIWGPGFGRYGRFR